VTTEYFPAARKDVLGVMMGARQVRPDEVLAYLPGAMAEHFTSAAAIFHSADQTKLSAWIAAGATASAGTVTEPYAIWTKFPHARFFVHYAAGCTMLESFFQAIRCPLQILLVGDPLAQPWAPADGLALAGVPAGGTAGRFTVEARVDPAARRHYGRFLFLLDGRPVGREPRLELDAARLTEGAHTVRAVASRSGLVRTQVFAEQSFRIGHQPVSGAQGGKPGKAADG
jgi:hypothetical protein